MPFIWACATAAVVDAIAAQAQANSQFHIDAINADRARELGNPQSSTCGGCGAPWEKVCSWCLRGRSDDRYQTTQKVQYGHARQQPEFLANRPSGSKSGGLQNAIRYDPRGGVPIRRGDGWLFHAGSLPFRPSLSGRGSKFQLQRSIAACCRWWTCCVRWLERAGVVCLRAISG